MLAIVVMTAVVYVLKNYMGVTGIETIGDRFQIKAALPQPTLLAINMETILFISRLLLQLLF